jgi:hypothetical protein
MPTRTVKRGRDIYKFNKKPILKRQEMEIVTRKEVREEVLLQRTVGEMVVRGHSYDTIGEQLGIGTARAFELARSLVKKWSGDLAMTANEVKEIDVKRIDAMIELATANAFPHPVIDPKTGDPQLYANGEPILTEADTSWTGILLNLLDRRAKLLGLDAADKLRENAVDIMTRRYIGGDPDAL